MNDNKTANPRIKIRVIIRSVIFAVIVITGFFGMKDPVITVESGNIEISGMFGTTVPISEVNSVTLLDESMSALGTGRRTSGFGGLGDTLRGKFDLNGDMRFLYVRSNSSPTIFVDSDGERDIYISYRAEAETMRVYDLLKEACGG